MLTIDPAYEYQVGGSLPLTASSYVTRQADENLYQALLKRQFCYVLSARQMGKSSLRIRTMQRLRQAGVRSSAIDMTTIGSQQIRLEQWYASVLQALVSGFQLSVNLVQWWRERQHLSPVKCFSDFLETVLLVEIEQPIVIFIDEIDSVLSLNFPMDDFFALIRSCYNQRAEQPAYRRLTFALLGVATPSDLIADRSRTPFNIGREIELKGFQMEESRPLLPGLQGSVSQPEALLQAVLSWTGGQPFLTQKVCQLILEHCRSRTNPIPAGQESAWLAGFVRKSVIDHWELRDDPEHLRTIAHRLLYDEQQAGQRLGLYQRVLTAANRIPATDDRAQIDLLLSGLVVKQQGYLQVCNRIYREVFNADWIEQQLAELRPYAAAFTAWRLSHCQDESRLLQGQALKDAQTWTQGKSLSDLDYRFLAASQALEQRKLQLVLEVERSRDLQARLKQEQKTARLQRSFLGVTGLALMVTIGLGLFAVWEYRKAGVREIQATAKASEALFASERRLEALVEAIRAREKLLSLGSRDAQTITQVETVLRQAAYGAVESNQLLGHQDSVLKVAISPDGQMVASASRDGTAKLWSAAGRLLHTLKGHRDWVTDVDFSPDGQTIVTTSKDKTIKLWRRDGSLSRTLTGHRDGVVKIAISPNGQLLASASWDRTVKLWTIAGRLLHRFDQHQGPVWSVAFSPNGQLLASGGADNTGRVWTLDGRLVRSLQGHRNAVQTIAFSPDGQLIASGSRDMTVNLWKVDGQLLRTYKGHRDEILELAFSPDSQFLASASSDGTVQLWLRDGTLFTTLEHGGGRMHSVAFSPNGKWLASGSADSTVRLWRLHDRLFTSLIGHQDKAARVAFSPNGQLLASASADQTVKLWTREGRLLRTLTGQHGFFSVAFSRNSQMLAAGSEGDGTIKLWSPDGQVLATLTGHQAGVYGLAFSPDGRLLASGSLDKTIKLWSTVRAASPRKFGTFLKTLSGHQQDVIAVKFSPDGQYLASAGWNGEIMLWHRDGRLIWTVATVAGGVNDLDFSPNGQMLASANGDSTIKLWTLGGKLIRSFTGHKRHVISVAFSPDGQRLASVSQDTTTKLWTLDGTLLATLDAHTNTVPGVAYSPDGQLVASSSWDKTLILWDLNRVVDLTQVIQFSCEWIQDYLTANPQVSDRDRLCQGGQSRK
jgi:WD40 repeat protein